jgi:hypothetical protein
MALAASVAVAGCDDSSPTSPSGATLVFAAVLRPGNEVPPVSNAESSGSGAVQVTIQPARDSAGTITGGTADFYFQVSGFPGPLTVVGAHIHPGAAGVNGPVSVSTGLTAGAPAVFADGTGEFRASGIAVSAAALQAIVANPSAFYFNAHSPLNPGGFARGQLARVQ